jgi:hypothetical protein
MNQRVTYNTLGVRVWRLGVGGEVLGFRDQMYPNP